MCEIGKKEKKEEPERRGEVHLNPNDNCKLYNIRGLSKREKRREVRDLIKMSRAEMCCI